MTAGEPVLLAEDDENDVYLVQRAFVRSGIGRPLEVVATGEEAIDYLAGTGRFGDRTRHPYPSLLLLDLKLPRRSGFEVLAWLRTGAGAQGLEAASAARDLGALPVAVLTSSSQERDIHRAYAMGANAYLVKTGQPAELTAMIRGVGRFFLGPRE
jgi:CheY-like chemotaxis protein